MTFSVHLLIEHPSPMGDHDEPLTSIFTNSFEERVILRMLPLLGGIGECSASLVISPTALEKLFQTDWTNVVDSALSRVATSGFELADHLVSARAVLEQHNGSVLDYYSSFSQRDKLNFVARPFEGIDLACWLSVPGFIDFNFWTTQRLFESYLGARVHQISLIDVGYTPLLDAAVHDAGFNIVYVDSLAYLGSQSKLSAGVHLPVLSPANGIAICGVDETFWLTASQAPDTLKSLWRHTGKAAVMRDEHTLLATECMPASDGATSPYEQTQAYKSARTYGRSHLERIRQRITRRKLRYSKSLTTVFLPDSTAFWCEEVEACHGFVERASEVSSELTTVTKYLTAYPDQTSAWLGVTVARWVDETAQQWLPRRVAQVYEHFRIAENSGSAAVVVDDLEVVARLLLFAQVSLRFFRAQPILPFLEGTTPAYLLDIAHRRLGLDQNVHDGDSSEVDLGALYTWGSRASLVRVDRGE